MAQVFDIPANKVKDAERQIARANKRLTAAGIDEQFTLQVDIYEKVITGKDGLPFQAQRAKITLNRPSISYNGYTFLARIEEVANGKFVAYTAPGVELMGWRPKSMECEHCHKTRKRSKVYVISDTDGNYKTVGGTCVELYTGLTPASLWALDWNNLSKHHDDDWEESENLFGKFVYRSDDVLKLAYILVKKEGYRPTTHGNSTKNKILTALEANDTAKKKAVKPLLEAAEKEDAQAIRTAVHANLAGNTYSDWATNVLAVIDEEYVQENAVGLLASSLKAVVEAEAREKINEGVENDWYSPVGTALIDLEVTLVEVRSGIESFARRSNRVYYMTFHTTDGYRIFWKSGSKKLPALGDKIVMDAVVRSLNEYRGEKSTRVAQVKWWPSPYED